MEYKRLTRKIINKYTGNQYTACEYNEIYQNGSALCQVTNRLGELEDKIENGLLIELPCKIGDTLYYESIYSNKIEGRIIKRINIDFVVDTPTLDCSIPLRQIGNSAFTTKEQAKAKLKELQGKE